MSDATEQRIQPKMLGEVGHSLTDDDISRFWRQVEIRADNECWPWRIAKDRQYGQFWLRGKRVKSTQVSWSLFHNQEFPAGKMACHTCDNTACVNPRHIWPGTMSENTLDCISKGRFVTPKGMPKQYKAACVKGHNFTLENKQWTKNGRYICRECNRARKKLWYIKYGRDRYARTALETSKEPQS